eukprot:3789412-Amphidinium_carterae.1
MDDVNVSIAIAAKCKQAASLCSKDSDDSNDLLSWVWWPELLTPAHWQHHLDFFVILERVKGIEQVRHHYLNVRSSPSQLRNTGQVLVVYQRNNNYKNGTSLARKQRV